MPDMPENQRAYPQNVVQQPGLGFPIARIAAVFSLACGAVLDLGICRYAGKGQSESGLLRTLWTIFRPGDVVLADRLLCAWTELVMLKLQGVDSVCRFTSHRRADFRRGKRLGEGDHIVIWPKPPKPRSIDRQTYDSLPEFLTIRECRVRIEQSGFRTKIPGDRHDAVGCRRVRQERFDLALPHALERRTGPEIVETNTADGRVALQNAGAGDRPSWAP